MEEELKLCHSELLKEEIYSDIVKAREVEKRIEELEPFLDGKMEFWEQLSLQLEK